MRADDDDRVAVWTCIHEHKSAIDAQLCGVEFLTSRPRYTRAVETAS